MQFFSILNSIKIIPQVLHFFTSLCQFLIVLETCCNRNSNSFFFLNLKLTCLWLTVHRPILNCYFCVFCSKCNLQSSGFHRTSSSIQYWSIAVFAHYFAILWYFLNLFCFVVFRTLLSLPPPPSLANIPQWISPVLIIAMNNVSFQASAAVKLNNGALMPSIALG